jgi:cytochrome c biogenesis protein CcmG/thiol:disulfide interchange protein DsbE
VSDLPRASRFSLTIEAITLHQKSGIIKSAYGTFLVATFAILLLCGCGGQDESTPLVSRAAPDFALKDLNGRVYRLADYKGHVVLLNFFATWCGPCRQEIPHLLKLRQKFGDQGVEVIGVSLDHEIDTVLRPFIQRYGITYPVLLGTREVVLDYGGIRGIPTTFVIDHNGTISDYFAGMPPSYLIEESVTKLLKQKG